MEKKEINEEVEWVNNNMYTNNPMNRRFPKKIKHIKCIKNPVIHYEHPSFIEHAYHRLETSAVIDGLADRVIQLEKENQELKREIHELKKNSKKF